jgi:hypothetical protein
VHVPCWSGPDPTHCYPHPVRRSSPSTAATGILTSRFGSAQRRCHHPPDMAEPANWRMEAVRRHLLLSSTIRLVCATQLKLPPKLDFSFPFMVISFSFVAESIEQPRGGGGGAKAGDHRWDGAGYPCQALRATPPGTIVPGMVLLTTD